MDTFDNVDQMLKQLYDNAVARKTELEAELQKVDATIEKLGLLYGGKAYTSDVLSSVDSSQRMARREDGVKLGRGSVRERKVREGLSSKGEGRRRVKQEEVRQSCMNFLTMAAPESRSGSEILDYLVREEGYTRNNSLRSRVYSLLGQWADDPSLPIVRNGRGVYAIKRD